VSVIAVIDNGAITINEGKRRIDLLSVSLLSVTSPRFAEKFLES